MSEGTGSFADDFLGRPGRWRKFRKPVRSGTGTNILTERRKIGQQLARQEATILRLVAKKIRRANISSDENEKSFAAAKAGTRKHRPAVSHAKPPQNRQLRSAKTPACEASSNGSAPECSGFSSD